MAEYKLNYTGAQINAALGRVLDGVPYNLLDNSDFRNPVNQRGETTYSGNKYTIDRWRTYSVAATVTIGSGYLERADALMQFLDIDPDMVYTAAVCKADGSVVLTSGAFRSGFGNASLGIRCSYTNSLCRFLMEPSLGNVVWAALYEGSYTSDTLPSYQPKGYAAELAECQRYYQIIPEQTSCAFSSSAQSGKYFASSINFPQMRITPTVSLKTDSNGYIGVVQGVAFVSTSEFDFAYKLNGTLLPATTNANYAGKVMSFYGVYLNADL